MLQKKINLNQQVKIIYALICAVSVIVLMFVPASVVQSWSLKNFYKEYWHVADIAGGIWYIGLIGIIASVVLVFIGYGMASFIGYCVYALTMLVFFYQLFLGIGNYDNGSYYSFPKAGGYIDIFLFIGVTIMAIIILKNTLSDKTPVTLSNSKASVGADEVLKYKELLDSGVITEEEFEKKKKELLGL